MYLAIDFLISPELKLYLEGVNVGLPWGAHQYHLTHLVHFGKPSDIFRRIEWTSRKVYGKTFKDYIHSLPFTESLKSFEIWVDGAGAFPKNFHPGWRLLDRWNQYELIKAIALMPETIPLDTEDLVGPDRFIEKRKKVILKRRVGKQELQIISDPSALWKLNLIPHRYLLQEYVESKVNGYTLFIRSIAFGGEFMCMVANLSDASTPGHGVFAFISSGARFGLSEGIFKTESFNQRSWEFEISSAQEKSEFQTRCPREELVAQTTLTLPEPFIRIIKEVSLKVERLFDSLDHSGLPKACFEK